MTCRIWLAASPTHAECPFTHGGHSPMAPGLSTTLPAGSGSLFTDGRWGGCWGSPASTQPWCLAASPVALTQGVNGPSQRGPGRTGPGPEPISEVWANPSMKPPQKSAQQAHCTRPGRIRVHRGLWASGGGVQRRSPEPPLTCEKPWGLQQHPRSA